MPSQADLPPLIVILGPTAVGKTVLSLELAEHLDGEIVSADSRLFYHGMDIGTAKPTLAERARVRHHLVDIAEPDEIWSLGKFKRAALDAIDGIHQRGKVPLLVGGAGQYIRAITQGWVIPKLKPDDSLRLALNKWAGEIGSEGLHERLASIDSEAAARILPGNVRRTIRALEVIFITGEKFSEQATRENVPYRVLQIGLNRPRQELFECIDQRVDDMMAAGFLDEVKALIEKGYSPELPSMSAIGYSQVIAHIRGEITLEEATAEIKRVTHKFVRRQMTWFKPTDEDIHWFTMSPTGLGEIKDLAAKFLLR